MKRQIAISLVIAGIAFTGCHSKENNPDSQVTMDSTSSMESTPKTDTLIKDTVMKDSVGKQKQSATPDKVSSQ